MVITMFKIKIMDLMILMMVMMVMMLMKVMMMMMMMMKKKMIMRKMSKTKKMKNMKTLNYKISCNNIHKTINTCNNKLLHHLHLKKSSENNYQNDKTEEPRCRHLLNKESNKIKTIYGSNWLDPISNKNKVSIKSASINRTVVFELHKSKTQKILTLTSMRVVMTKTIAMIHNNKPLISERKISQSWKGNQLQVIITKMKARKSLIFRI